VVGHIARMERMKFLAQRVLITGASSGLGRELAVQLARDFGANVVLVARRHERLQVLAEEIRRAYRVGVECIAADLGEVGEVERVFNEATRNGPLYAAILNAGVTHFGDHDELSFGAFEEMLDLNVRCTVRLTMLLAGHMEREAAGGGVLLVASLSGVTPVAYQSAYSGTKGFLVKYGWALHHEMAPRGVTVSVFAPGGIVSEMTAGARFNDLRRWLMPVDRAARSALRGFARRKAVTIPGILYDWGRSLLLKVIPENFLVGQMARQYRSSLERHG
jgi:uncharacterized protein